MQPLTTGVDQARSAELWWDAVLRAGSQLRVGASDVREGLYSELEGVTFRAVILVYCGSNAHRAALIAQGAFAAELNVPITVCNSVPRWVSPLDLVVCLSDLAESAAIAQALELAHYRHAQVVLNAPPESPIVKQALGLRSVRISHRSYQPYSLGADVFSIWNHLGTALSVFHILYSDGPKAATVMEKLADQVDSCALTVGPHADEFTSIAHDLAIQIKEHKAYFIFDTPTTGAIASHGATQFDRLANCAVTCLDVVDWSYRPVLNPQQVAVDDIFYDPYEDSAGAASVSLPARGFLFTTLGRLVTTLDYVRRYGDVREVVDLTSTVTDADRAGLDGLLAQLLYLEVAALVLHCEVR